MTSNTKAYLIGGGIGSLSAAAFMIGDGGISGTNITIFDGRRSWLGNIIRAPLGTCPSQRCIEELRPTRQRSIVRRGRP